MLDKLLMIPLPFLCLNWTVHLVQCTLYSVHRWTVLRNVVYVVQFIRNDLIPFYDFDFDSKFLSIQKWFSIYLQQIQHLIVSNGLSTSISRTVLQFGFDLINKKNHISLTYAYIEKKTRIRSKGIYCEYYVVLNVYTLSRCTRVHLRS